MNVRTVGCCSSTDAVTLCLDSLKMPRLFCLTTLLVLTGETVLVHAAPVDRPAILLDISLNNDKDQNFGSLEVKCSLDTSLAHMTSLASLAMMGSKLPGNSESFDELARVDVWSSAPEVADHLSKDRVVVKGCNGQPPCGTPNLVMSWSEQDKEYSYFKCVARGMDSDGKPITVSSAVKPEQENSLCSESKDPVYCELQKMSSKLQVITDTSGKLSLQVQALDAKYDSLEKGFEELGRKFESLKEGVDAKYDSLKKDVDGKHDSLQDSDDTENNYFESVTIR